MRYVKHFKLIDQVIRQRDAYRDHQENTNAMLPIQQTYLGHYAFGIDSAIGSSFNFAPQLYLQINEALENNDVAKAKRLQKTVTELYATLFKHGKGGIDIERSSPHGQFDTRSYNLAYHLMVGGVQASFCRCPN